MKISWTPPEPRKGWKGAWDRFVGPGATSAEFWLQLVPAVVAGIALPLYALLGDLGWNLVQVLVAGLLAFDMTGGIVTNATSTAKRWYHREGQGVWQHFGFILVHGAQIFLVAWLFRGLDWPFFGTFYSYLIVTSLVILWAPLYLRRPLALILYCGAVVLGLYVFPAAAGMEWFVPFFFLKLLVSHLVKEAPYRPADESGLENGVSPLRRSFLCGIRMKGRARSPAADRLASPPGQGGGGHADAHGTAAVRQARGGTGE